MAWWELAAFWAMAVLLGAAVALRLIVNARRAGAQKPSGLVLAAAIGTPVLAVALYLVLGRPGAPDTGFEARYQTLIAAGPEALERLQDSELVVLLERRAKDNPTDATPHIILAQVMLRAERFPDAVRALQSALRRDPQNADAWIMLGQALMLANGGPSRPAVDALKAGQAALPEGERRAQVGRMIAALENVLANPEAAPQAPQAPETP